MFYKKKIPKCQDERPQCFARTNRGNCNCLDNTNFNGKFCPFYKSQEDYIKGVRKYGGYLNLK